MRVGVGGGDALRVQNAVEHDDGGCDRALGVQFVKPRLRLALARERDRIDDGCAHAVYRRWGGLCRDAAPTRACHPSQRADPARGVAIERNSVGGERAEHDHALGLATSLGAQQVAAVGRSQLPWELELDEEKEPWRTLCHRCTVSFSEMSDPSSAVKNIRERLAGASEESLGRALSDLLDNSLLTGVIGRAFDAREKAVQAQEVAMGALNLPSAADIERLTRRLRAVSQRLEGIEDGVQRLDRALASHGVESQLSKIEEQLGTLAKKLGQTPSSSGQTSANGAPATAKPTKAKAKPKAAGTASAKPKAAKRGTAKPTKKT